LEGDGEERRAWEDELRGRDSGFVASRVEQWSTGQTMREEASSLIGRISLPVVARCIDRRADTSNDGDDFDGDGRHREMIEAADSCANSVCEEEFRMKLKFVRKDVSLSETEAE
jgi:hypothetical protein